jgi:hypothetical protein
MKKIVFSLLSFLFAVLAVAQPPQIQAEKGMYFGQSSFKAKKAKSVESVKAGLTAEEKEVKIKAKVVEVCKAEGCWLKLESAQGPVLVRMKDHGFLVPVSLVGKEVVIQGTAKIQETSVDMLRHYAEDAGKSKEEIASIMEPKKDMVVQATGVLVQ